MFPETTRKLLSGATDEYPDDCSPVFNALLFEVFPQAEFYAIYPIMKKITHGIFSRLAWTLTLRRKANALLVLDIRPADDISNATLRARADEEMRAILRQYKRKDTTVPKITGLSCFGTKFRVYEYNVSTKAIIPGVARSKDSVASELWGYDFTRPDGAQTFEILAREIMVLAENVEDNKQKVKQGLKKFLGL